MLSLLEHWNDVLFPGFLVLAIVGAGLWIGVWAPEEGYSQRETVWFYAVLAASVTWASFGPQAGLYTLLYHTIPALSLLRVPARITILVVVSLCVPGAVAVTRWLGDRPLRTRSAMAGVLTLLMVLELAAMPIWWERAESLPAAHQILAQLPRGPVVELPFFSERSGFFRHSSYLLNSTGHWFPLINGYGDHISQDFLDAALRSTASRPASRSGSCASAGRATPCFT